MGHSVKDWDNEHLPDGTRRGDNFIQRQIDRANGSAEARTLERQRLESVTRSNSSHGSISDAVSARQNNPETGRPRWMDPFSKVDVFGKPTVFSNDFKFR